MSKVSRVFRSGAGPRLLECSTVQLGRSALSRVFCALVFQVNQKWIGYSYSGLPKKSWRFITKDSPSKMNPWHSPGHKEEWMTRGLQRLKDLYGHKVHLRLFCKAYSNQLLKLQCAVCSMFIWPQQSVWPNHFLNLTQNCDLLLTCDFSTQVVPKKNLANATFGTSLAFQMREEMRF